MDREAELIRLENWTGLKQFYAARSGHAWELAWIQLLKLRDYQKAAEEFQRCLQQPRFEEASYIVLWKLGKRPSFSKVARPTSLRLYEAFLQGHLNVLRGYLDRAQNASHLPYLLEHMIEHFKIEDVEFFAAKALPQVSFYFLGRHADLRLKNAQVASQCYAHFFQDPWIRKVGEEVSRMLFDADLSRRLRSAYAAKDGVTVKRLLKTAQFRVEKADDSFISPVWRETLKDVLDFESENLTNHLLGHPFWKAHDLSPEALYRMRQILFAPEQWVEPPFVRQWSDFFDSESWDALPVDLDPESLALWQIRVELHPAALSEALLKFPHEERFLFLWAVRQRDPVESTEPRKLPQDFKESEVVRKNLERAFDKSTNRVLWFDRLRSVGCSQDFYEYSIQKVNLPLDWILEDLKKGHLSASPVVRAYLADQLSLSRSASVAGAELSSEELTVALSYLTPAETQQVLLSRFVLTGIPRELITDDVLDLLWDAKDRVSKDVARRWLNEVLDSLQDRSVRRLSARQWRWIEWGWQVDQKYLQIFAPQLDSSSEFPWQLYLEMLDQYDEHGLMLTVIARVPSDRLKEEWIRKLMVGSMDSRVHLAIQSIQEDYVRLGLQAEWAEKRNELQKAVDFYLEEIKFHPILNHQMDIARHVLSLQKGVPVIDREKHVQQILDVSKFLETHGGLEVNTLREISSLFERIQDYSRAWRFGVQEWLRVGASERATLLERLSTLAFQGRLIEEMQRFLVDQIFQATQFESWVVQGLDVLLSNESAFKLKHLRKEFIERASQYSPVHADVLRERAAFDYRAVLLWEAFYGDDLEGTASPPSVEVKKRGYELLGFTEGASPIEAWAAFVQYLSHLPFDRSKSEPHEFLEAAQRITARLAKFYHVKKLPAIALRNSLATPFRITLDPLAIEISPAFFDVLDEELWSAISVGLFQLQQDRSRGLYEDRKLIERFFMGMLVSGAPIAKLIRLWVWLAIHESLIDAQVLKLRPQALVSKLPFLGALLVFFLGRSFDDHRQRCGIVPR